ncbi:phosphoribosylanthranilate isomerase [Microbacterium maritypicum]
MWVKVCGLRDEQSLDAAGEAGADAVGFVFAAKSPRFLAAADASHLVSRVPRSVATVGVFRRQPVDDVVRLATEAGVTTVQLHGDEPPSDFALVRAHGFRTIRATTAARYLAETPDQRDAYGEDLLLLDAPSPGAGRTFDASDLRTSPPSRDWALAGGLTPENVVGLIRDLRPWGVDVSSGVESAPGMKDPDRVRAFITAVRSVGPVDAA